MEKLLEKVNIASLKLLEPLTPEDTYATIIREALRLVDASHGSIFLEKEGVLERVYASMPVLYQTKIRKKGYAYNAFKTQQPHLLHINEVGKIHPKLKEIGVKNTLFIPLSHHKESIGVLTLNLLQDETYSVKELNLLKLFGSMSSLAIRKSQMYSETKKALEIRDMFMSMAAHELRTPLTSINGYIQLLHSRLAKHDTSEGKWIRELYDESKRMTNLVKELLEVNRIKSGQLQFVWQECQVTSVIKKAFEYMRVMFPERKVDFMNKIVSGKDSIIGDEDKLAQVLGNILDNAAKYSQKDKKITVELLDNNQNIIIRVVDQGKGISKKDLPYIFEGHKGETSGEEGMGIGLFFVDSVIRQHHGAITVKSKMNKGTLFEIRLPKAKL